MLSPQVSAVGTIAYNERDQVIVQARATGYVERLHVRATLDRVAKGQALAELYVPDWIAAQGKFLSVRRMQGTHLASLVDRDICGANQRRTARIFALSASTSFCWGVRYAIRSLSAQ